MLCAELLTLFTKQELRSFEDLLAFYIIKQRKTGSQKRQHASPHVQLEQKTTKTL